MAKKKTQTTAPIKRTRRSPDQMIKDLEAQILRIKARAEQRKARRDPALRHVTAAVRSIDKAMAATTDTATRQALQETRATLGACLKLNGVALKTNSGASRDGSAQVDPEAVLAYLRNNPGSGGEQVATAMGTDTATLRPVMKELIAEGQVAASGKGRGMRYERT
jgi:hypothetical protein